MPLESGVPDGMMEVMLDGKPALRRIDCYGPMEGGYLGSSPKGPLVPWPVLREDERLNWTVGGSAIITTGIYYAD